MNLLEEVKQSGRLKGIAMDVYEIIFHTAGLTGGEIWRRYKAMNPKTKLSRNDTQKRVNDLVNWGAVLPTGTKAVCAVSGKTVMTWKATGKVPTRTPQERAPAKAGKAEGIGQKPNAEFEAIMAHARTRRLKAEVLDQVRNSLKQSGHNLNELKRLLESSDKWYTGTARARRQRRDALDYALRTLDYILHAQTEPK